jgi:hypothetical protein
MNNIWKMIFQHCFVVLFAVLIMQSAAHGATEITGTVTAKRDNSVKVEFTPHETVRPKIGDLVVFKKTIKGYELNAGRGEVAEVKANFVWVKILEEPVNLTMSGVITTDDSHIESPAKAIPESEETSQIDELQPTKSRLKEFSAVAHLTVRSNVSGDILYLDGKAMGPTGPRAKNVTPGRHQLRVEKHGYQPFTQTLELTEGAVKTIRVELKAIPENWITVSIKYDDSGTIGLTLRIPPDWKHDSSDTGRWIVFKPDRLSDYDVHIHVNVLNSTHPIKTPSKFRKGMLKDKNMKRILEEPKYVYLDKNKALYAKVEAVGGGKGFFPYIKNGTWNIMGYQLIDRNKKVYINAFCKTNSCTASTERTFKKIIKSIKFFKKR